MVDVCHSAANLKMSVVIDSMDQHMINIKSGIVTKLDFRTVYKCDKVAVMA